MKKLLSVILTVAMTLSLVACGKSNNPEQSGVDSDNTPVIGEVDHTKGDTIKWIFGHGQTEDNPAVIATVAFADAIEEATGGRWTIDVYAGGSLGSELEVLEMTRVNTVQLFYANISSMEQYVPDFGVYVLPYLFHTWEDVEDYLEKSPKGTALWDTLEEVSNLKFIGCQFNGTRCLSTAGIDPVKSPADLKGVKIRSMEAPVWQNVIKALGGTPVPVAFTEVYMGLQTGVVQGQENPLSVTYFQKFFEVLDDLYKTDHCYNISTIVSNPEAWNSLSDSDKALFEEMWEKYMVDYYNEIYAEYENIALQAMADAGVRIWEQSDLDMEAFYASANEIVESEYMTDDLYSGYIKDIRERYNY